MIRLISILIILLITLISLQAETLRGKVVDEETKDLIPNVNIYVRELRLYTQTDGNGSFMIEKIDPGIYHFTFRRIGYLQQELAYEFTSTGKLEVLLKKEVQKIEGLKVSATRAKVRETPITFNDMDVNRIRESNYGQDIPMILDDLPNVFSYSEAGNGFGYTYVKLRGFDQSRIGVMINGIPLNDPEDHQVYWVDMPDFAENISNIQIQRGVGNSLYGISTFGGSINLETSILNEQERVELFSNYGSYDTYKVGGKIYWDFLPGYKLSLRFSTIESDGYRDNSAVELWSYFTGLSRIGERSVTELNVYGGKEITHAAWYASAESDLEEDHQHNPIEYDNEIDDFNQPHFELHHKYYLNENINLCNTLFYIRGDGYYEQFKEEEDLWEYGLEDESDSLFSDLVRRKQIAKNHYGLVSEINWKHLNGKLDLGFYGSLFDSKHWGEIHQLDKEVPEFKKGMKYYRYLGDKSYLTFYLNENYRISQTLNFMLNLYYQMINYEFAQKEEGNFSGVYLNSYKVDYNFFNPRFGLNYNLNEKINFYANASYAQREPADNELFDIWDGPDDLGIQPLFSEGDTLYINNEIVRIEWSDPVVKEESLIDYELGAAYRGSVVELGLNLFWMDFKNEIVAYGGTDEDGYPIRGNAEKTVHRGIELSFITNLPYNLELSSNLAYNDNYFVEFKPFNWSGETDNYNGNRIAGFPELLFNSRLAYRDNNFLVWVKLQHVGKQYLDNTENEQRVIDPFQVVDLGLIYNCAKFMKMPELEFSFKVSNLFDREYYTAGYNDSWADENYFWPAAGRNYMIGLRVKF